MDNYPQDLDEYRAGLEELPSIEEIDEMSEDEAEALGDDLRNED